MKSDIEISQQTELKPICDVAQNLGILNAIENYGPFKAKIDIAKIDSAVLNTSQTADQSNLKKNKLVLVTSINPTAAGEGKTTTTIGLSDALNHIGHSSIVCLREPALGPVFGKKGGATGGGYAQVAPMDEINLHFTGDFHAIAAAHNLLSAMVDNHIYHGNALGIQELVWRRVIDMNDRSLRANFDIVVASEVMAILCLVDNFQSLKLRLGNITVGYDQHQQAVTAKQLKAEGAMAALLKEAIKPNLVQTLHGNPAIIHGGPFANIAHGCNSVIATKLGMQLAEFTVTEAGFGSDLGAEKFLDIKCRKSGIWPDVVVIVATIKAIKLHGQGDLKKGFYNLAHHIQNIRNNFNLPVVVGINRYTTDTPEEIAWLKEEVASLGVEAVLSSHWSDGAIGAVELANKVVEMSARQSRPQFVYADEDPLSVKIQKVIRQVYGGADIDLSEALLKKLNAWDKSYRHFPICIAKTHSSLSAEPNFSGIPKDEVYPIKEFRLCTGAEYLVVMMGNIITLPGLPKVPAAEHIDINSDGYIIGLS